ncbi:MAG: acetyl-CoA carboxylase biotin carboxyl carrier protein subunit [Phycisphaerae bacterium]|nr:acetyl-CoA carboxylase biotin carboxyl carrier protein subunit [Saprospiraceae bacterium]
MEKKEPFNIAVNGSQHEFALQPEDAKNLDIVPDGEGAFQILHHGRSFRAEFLEANYPARQFSFRINGVNYTLHIADQYERLVQQLGLNVGGSQKQNVVKAPMPGLVLNVMVAPGQTVSKGEPLLILEAMKMENVIKAANDGIVKTVAVQKGAAVEKGHLLLEME